MTTERIDIIVREDGSRVVKRNLEEIGNGAVGVAGKIDKMTSSLKIMQGIMAATGIAMVLRSFIQNTIEAEQTVAQLNAALKSTAGVSGQTSKGLQKMASDLQDVTTYGDEAIMQMQSVLLTFTRLRGNQFVEAQESVLNLATAMKMDLKSAALQVGKALNDPVAGLSALSRAGIQFTDDQKELIKKLAEGGQMAEAQTLILKELETQFGGSARAARDTLGGALTALKEKFGDMFELSSEFSEPFRKFIEFLNVNMETILKVITILAATIAAAFVPTAIAVFAGWVGTLATQLRNLWILIAANPLGALLVAVTAVATSLTLFRDQIKLGIDDTTTLGDLMRAIWEQMLPVIKAVAGSISDFFNWMVSAGQDAFSKVGKSNESAWLTIIRFVARAVDSILGLLLGLHDAARRIFSAIADFVRTTFGNAVQQVKALFAGDFDKALEIGAAQLDNAKNTGLKLGDAIGEGLNTGFGAIMEGGLESKLNKALARAQEIGKGRAGGLQGPLGGPGAPPGGGSTGIDGDAAKKAARELEQLRSALRGVLDEANPVAAAQRKLAETQDILNKSVAAGLITQAQARVAYEAIASAMEDQLDPLGALNRQVDESIKLLGMSNEQRQIESQMLDYTRQLKLSGLDVGEQELEQLRAKLVAEQELAKIAGLRNELEGQTIAAQKQGITDLITAYGQLKATTEQDDYNFMNRLLGGSLEESRSTFSLQLEQFAEYYAIIDELRQADLVSEQQASDARKQIQQMEMESKLDFASNLFGQLTVLMQTNSKKAFKIGQAAAIGEAMINTYKGVSGAIANAYDLPYPINIVAAVVGSASALAAGIAQVSKIRSQQMPGYRTGGSYTFGGSGGPDSQSVAIRGTPGETININTPSQANAMQSIATMMRNGEGQRGRGDIHMNLTVVQQGRPDKTTPRQNARAMQKGAEKLLDGVN